MNAKETQLDVVKSVIQGIKDKYANTIRHECEQYRNMVAADKFPVHVSTTRLYCLYCSMYSDTVRITFPQRLLTPIFGIEHPTKDRLLQSTCSTRYHNLKAGQFCPICKKARVRYIVRSQSIGTLSLTDLWDMIYTSYEGESSCQK